MDSYRVALKKVKSRSLKSIWFAISASIANLLLIYFATQGSLFFGGSTLIVVIGFIALFASACSLYFGIPYYDEETQTKYPMTRAMYFGVSLGLLNLLGAITLTPLVFIIWGTMDLGSISSLTSLF
ncbi:MAG: hypothetical protein E3J54_00270 [Actinobacteria bacterium]|nr:MAG: hypothetical protein E3J54_00270 [Actinomycetota bacterium]